MDIDFTLDCELDDVAFTFDPDLVADDEPVDDIELLFIDVPDMRLKAWVADVYVEGDKIDLITLNAVNGMDAAEKMHQWAAWKYGDVFISFGIGTYADYVGMAA